MSLHSYALCSVQQISAYLDITYIFCDVFCSACSSGKCIIPFAAWKIMVTSAYYAVYVEVCFQLHVFLKLLQMYALLLNIMYIILKFVLLCRL